ncbi:MAG: L7Ae/L30e/S12e/Gadd45 family ribosomal protein [Eubacteriales bacterium]
MINKKVLSLLGIAKKAGNLVGGEFSTEAAIKGNKACMIIIADDASKNTKKKFTNSCRYYNVPLFFFGEKDTLGHAIGKSYCASIALLDKGLAEAIKNQLE